MFKEYVNKYFANQHFEVAPYMHSYNTLLNTIKNLPNGGAQSKLNNQLVIPLKHFEQITTIMLNNKNKRYKDTELKIANLLKTLQEQQSYLKEGYINKTEKITYRNIEYAIHHILGTPPSVFLKLLQEMRALSKPGKFSLNKEYSLLEKLFKNNPTKNSLNISAPKYPVAYKEAYQKFLEELNKPKIYILINPFNKNNKPIQNTISATKAMDIAKMLKNEKNPPNNAIFNFANNFERFRSSPTAVRKKTTGPSAAAPENKGMNDFFQHIERSQGTDNKPSAIIMLGASGAGKTSVFTELLNYWIANKKIVSAKRIVISPVIYLTKESYSHDNSVAALNAKNRQNNSNEATYIHFTESYTPHTLPFKNENIDPTEKDNQLNQFMVEYTRPTPFNEFSSRAHHLFKLKTSDNKEHILGDLCGTESATAISKKALGINIFSQYYLPIFHVSATFASLHETVRNAFFRLQDKEKYKPTKASFTGKVKNEAENTTRASYKKLVINKVSNELFPGPKPDSQRAKNTSELIHLMAFSLMALLNTKYLLSPNKSTYNKEEGVIKQSINFTDLKTKKTKEFFKVIPTSMAGYKNKLAYKYIADTIMRCLESMWISRTLDELSLIYDTNSRLNQTKNQTNTEEKNFNVTTTSTIKVKEKSTSTIKEKIYSARLNFMKSKGKYLTWATSKNYHVPAEMEHIPTNTTNKAPTFGTYKMNMNNFIYSNKGGILGGKPFALGKESITGVRIVPTAGVNRNEYLKKRERYHTPLSALSTTLEQNLKLNKNNENIIQSSNIHRLFILIKIKKMTNKNNNWVIGAEHKKTLRRLSTLAP